MVLRQLVKKYRKQKTRIKKKWNGVLRRNDFLREAEERRKRIQYYRFCMTYGIDEKLVLFVCRNGQAYAESPKALYLEMKADPLYADFRFVWEVDHLKSHLFLKEDDRTSIVKSNTKKCRKAYAIATYRITNSPIDRICYPKRKKQIHLYNMDTILSRQEFEEIEKTADRIYQTKDASQNVLKEVILLKEGEADGWFMHYLRNHHKAFMVYQDAIKLLRWMSYVKRKSYRSVRSHGKQAVLAFDVEIERRLSMFRAVFVRLGVVKDANVKKLLSYEKKYAGKRCFLVGNGPSLTIEDLELMKNEVTFACNRIYKLYEKTTWRPTFHCLIDAIIAKYEYEDVAANIESPFFTNQDTLRLMKEIPKDVIVTKNIGKKEYRVSNDFFAYYIPSGATVMTFMIELAMYMGFTEIYLIGVDCTSSVSGHGHFVKNYVRPELLEKDLERVRKRLGSTHATKEEVAEYYFNQSTFAYRILASYAKEHGIQIINATRGGKLEVYPRMTIEDVLVNSRG